MRLKNFCAPTAKEAMQMVRETLGEDAIIVATREEKGGKGGVRVTAAIEQRDSFEDFGGDFGSNTDWTDGDSPEGDEAAEEAVLEKLTDVMLRHAVPEEITDQVLSCATVIGPERADTTLTAALEHLFSFRPLPQQPTGTAYMMVGPPGAGKTLAVAKLAARAVMNAQSVAVISTDTVRAGGIEQLSAFTKLMKVNLQKAGSLEQFRDCLARAQGADQVYIDTAGMNPYDTDSMRSLARMMSAGDIQPVLVMPAGVDAEESGDIARVYSTLGITSMMPARLDIARRLGGILSAAHYGGLIFADAGNTPKVANGLMAMTPQILTGLLMPESVKKKAKAPAATGRKQMVHAG